MATPIQILIDFFREFFARLSTKSPAFFKVLMVFMASLTFAGYIPSMLQQWFGVEVSGGVIHLCETIAHYTTGFLIASGLTAKPDVVGQTEKGMEVKVTDKKRMPFTANKEMKEIAKKVPPADVLENVPENDQEKKD